MTPNIGYDVQDAHGVTSNGKLNNIICRKNPKMDKRKGGGLNDQNKINIYHVLVKIGKEQDNEGYTTSFVFTIWNNVDYRHYDRSFLGMTRLD